MSLHWYAHHLGDYSKDTRHLTMLEHGAYRLLLDQYYTIGGPIKDERKSIYRICQARTPQERAAVDKILDQFFILDEHSFWNNNRATAEISKQKKISDLRKKAGANAHANKKQTVVLNDGNLQPTTYNQLDTNVSNKGFSKKKGNGYAENKPTGSSTVEELIRKWDTSLEA